jgi:fumarate reductase flavoprotein subunit
MFADIQRKNHGEADPAVVRAACEASGPAIEWLNDKHGVAFQLVEGFLYPGHTEVRMHCVPEKTGSALLASLLRACSGLDIVTSAHVKDVTEKQIRFERPNGQSESVEYGALVLACSGFGGNPQLVRQHIPEIADALYFGHAGNQGDALRWGEALGAATEHLGAYQGHGSVAVPHNVLITWALMMEGGIQVNAEGRRFSNETLGYSEQCLPVLQQPGGIAWCIYDERLHQLGMTFPDYRDAHEAGAVKPAPDLPFLKETLQGIGKGKDAFGRTFTTTLKPPLYGIKVTGALFHTQGGLKIDAKARVLRKDGRPLPNVFAAGGAACGLSGSKVWGYLSGNGLLSAVALGRIAGQQAASAI